MQEPAAAPQAPGLPAAAAGMAEAPADPTETDHGEGSRVPSSTAVTRRRAQRPLGGLLCLGTLQHTWCALHSDAQRAATKDPGKTQKAKASCCPGRGPRSCQEGPCFASPSGFLGADICWRQTGQLPTGSHQPRGPVLSPPEEQLAEACGTLSAEQRPFREFLLEPHEILLRGVNLRWGNRGPRGAALPCSRGGCLLGSLPWTPLGGSPSPPQPRIDCGGTRFSFCPSCRPDLEQKILQVLRGAGSPVKAAQLAKDCQVPKKRLNQVLYRMKEEAKVHLEGPATWRLGEGQTGEVVPTERAQPCQAARPQQEVAAIPETPCPQLSKRQMEIYRFLEASGPHKALSIAQALGMRTTKDVNRDLYTLRDRHLLNYDQKTSAWAVYQPENSGGRNQSATVIYQQNPITMICQNGPYSHISIENSEGIQIGHGNTIVRQTGSAENGSAAPLHLPPTTPADASTQGPLAGACSPQDIRIEKSVLRRVQLGHGNEMSFHSPPAEGPAHSPSGSPPVWGERQEGDVGARDPAGGHVKILTRDGASVPTEQGVGHWGDVRGGELATEDLEARLGVTAPGPPASCSHTPLGMSLFGRRTVSATSASPEAVFEIRTPEPGPHPQGDMVQRVQITSCFLEDTAIGNSNRMTASPGPAGPEGPAGPGDTRRDHGEPGQDAAAAPSGGERPHSAGQAARDSISTLAASLEAVSLESRGPETEEDGR
ncbi:hypothetical protein HPG69_016650 [Diceros bicornis minor]|uniref:Z-binding domain-containing protein n=1 Tax=Diceros bicornis minor TaxID=77932 RepID=A0A7J7FGZ4_DICBM|nr:hypothetical protein HPG69_016650 [Diceros bicornis minor]